MPLYIGDYLADTMHLSHSQHGIYMLLIMAYWRNGGPLSADMAQLSAIARCSPHVFAKNWQIIEKFFSKKEGKIFQKRIDAEIAAATTKTEERSRSGSEGARQRWAKPDGSAIVLPMANAWQNDAPLPSPLPERSKEDFIEKSPLPRKPASAAERGSRLHQEVLTQDWEDAAANARARFGLMPVNLTLEFEKFKNHWLGKTGKDGRKIDWKRTWANWVLNAYSPPTRQTNGKYDAGYDPPIQRDRPTGPPPPLRDAC